MSVDMQAHQVLGRWYPLPPIWLEGRAWLEWVALRRDPIFAGVGVPDGEGRPVLLVPGFLAGDRSLDIMRGWLRRNGYRPIRSGINLNVEASSVLVDRIARRLRKRLDRGTRAVVVGQSRGGSLAFGLSQRYPELVERIVTLGTPLGDPMDIHPTTMAAVHLVRALNTLRRGPRNIDERFDRDLRRAPTVPVTSLYSRTDGIVYWKACLRPDVESVDVGGSHIGMSINPRAYREIARVLSEGRSS